MIKNDKLINPLHFYILKRGESRDHHVAMKRQSEGSILHLKSIVLPEVQNRVISGPTKGQKSSKNYFLKIQPQDVLYIGIVIVCFRHGEKVPFARKGRFGVVHGSIVQHFHPFHLQIETGNREDLTEDEITKRVRALY